MHEHNVEHAVQAKGTHVAFNVFALWIYRLAEVQHGRRQIGERAGKRLLDQGSAISCACAQFEERSGRGASRNPEMLVRNMRLPRYDPLGYQAAGTKEQDRYKATDA